eukprot:916564-Karenia_brevis.AAC.1
MAAAGKNIITTVIWTTPPVQHTCLKNGRSRQGLRSLLLLMTMHLMSIKMAIAKCGDAVVI